MGYDALDVVGEGRTVSTLVRPYDECSMGKFWLRIWDAGGGLGISTSPEAVVLPRRAYWAKERDGDRWVQRSGIRNRGAISL